MKTAKNVFFTPDNSADGTEITELLRVGLPLTRFRRSRLYALNLRSSRRLSISSWSCSAAVILSILRSLAYESAWRVWPSSGMLS